MQRSHSLNYVSKAPRLTRAHTNLGLEPITISDPEPVRAVKDCQLGVFSTGKYIHNLVNNTERERENYLIAMVGPLVMYGAGLDTIEERLLAAAHHFTVKITLTRKPGHLDCILGDYGAQRRKIHVVDNGRRSTHLFGLLEVDDICRSVTHDEMRMLDAVKAFQSMDKEKPLSHPFRHVLMAAGLSLFMCAFVFNTSPLETWSAFGITIVLCALQVVIRTASVFAADCIEVSATVIVSLLAHDSSAHADIIIGVLPGFIYMCSMMKVNPTGIGASYDGHMRAMFALAYAFALKSGLPIIVDFFLMLRLYGLVLLSRALYDRIVQKRTVVTVRRARRKQLAASAVSGSLMSTEKCS